MISQQLAATAPRLFPAMTESGSCKAERAMDEFVARLAAAGLPDDERAQAYEAALKQLMDHLIHREGWLAEEFSGLARSLGAF